MPANVEDGCTVEKRKSVPDGVHLTPEGLGTFIALYYGLVKEVDDWVGRILDALERGGYRDNTLVIFVSDHGELMGNHGTFSKTKMFEESMRIPLIMRCPGVIPSGLRCSAPVSGVDLAPTILGLAGVPVPGTCHGRSLRLLFTPDGAWDREYAFCEYRDTAAIRSGSWKLVLNPSGSANLKERAFLYDLRNDPQEMANLLSANHRDSTSIELGLGLKRRIIDIMQDLGIVDHRIDIYHRLDLCT
jgi:arylsulfatase A-like enzyme